jgi:hypothetical protein
MNLKACYSNGQSVIYKPSGEIVYTHPARDENEAEIISMSNQEVRRAILDKLDTITMRVQWVPGGPDIDIGADTDKAGPADEIFRDVPVDFPPEDYKEKMNRLILDLEESDMAIETENIKHRDTMKELNKKQQDIKEMLYCARRGDIKTTVKCKIEMDYVESKKRVVRLDTGEILEEIEMTMEEKQLDAFQKAKATKKVKA